MRNLRFVLILGVVFLFSYFTPPIFAQWQPDVRLTFNNGIAYISPIPARCIAEGLSGCLHVVWYDFNGGNNEIRYKRSTDYGTSWSQDTGLTTNSNFLVGPSVSVWGLNVHLVWGDARTGRAGTFYKKSTDNGTTWSQDTCVSCSSNTNVVYPSISCCGSNVHIVWMNNPSGVNCNLYYKFSTDNGTTWSQDIRLTYSTGNSMFPAISVSGSYVHVVWVDDREGNPKIFYKRSSNNGSTWSQDSCLTNGPDTSYYASISSSGASVHVVWKDKRDGGNGEVYYKHSTDNGTSWSQDTRLTFDPALPRYPAVSSYGSKVGVIFGDNRNGNNIEIYFKSSSDGGMSWSQDVRLTNAPDTSYLPSLVLSDSMVHTVWSDKRDGNFEIYYKRNTGHVRTIDFAGRTWYVVSGFEGPGPNSWADTPENVYVDGNGQLHLKIRYINGTWYCSQVVTTNPSPYTSYGMHRFYVIGRIDSLDNNAVFSPFLYSDNFVQDSSELDLEFSKWGRVTDTNAYYNVWPTHYPGNSFKFPMRLNGTYSTHYINWKADTIIFKSIHGFHQEPPDPSYLIDSLVYTGNYIPPQQNLLRIIIILWLNQGSAPSDSQEVIVANADLPPPLSVEEYLRYPMGGLTAGQLKIIPNPLREKTVIRFQVQNPGKVTLMVYNITGQAVRLLKHESLMEARSYEVVWDGRDERGRVVPTGVYLLKLEAGEHREMSKVVLIR